MNFSFLFLILIETGRGLEEQELDGAINFAESLKNFRQDQFHQDRIPMMRKRFAYRRQRINAMNRYMDQIYNHSSQVV